MGKPGNGEKKRKKAAESCQTLNYFFQPKKQQLESDQELQAHQSPMSAVANANAQTPNTFQSILTPTSSNCSQVTQALQGISDANLQSQQLAVKGPSTMNKDGLESLHSSKTASYIDTEQGPSKPEVVEETQVNSSSVTSCRVHHQPSQVGESEPQLPTSDEHQSLGNHLYDVGNYINDTSMSDDVKFKLLTERWKPNEDYKFPLKQEGKKRRKFQYHLLRSHKWLAYSEVLGGILCVICMLFSSESTGKGSHQKPGILVKRVMKTWKNTKCDLEHHATLDYHTQSVKFADAFITNYETNNDILKQMDCRRKQEAERNKQVLGQIIKTVITLGRQGLPLRGHRDSGPLTEEEPEDNDGNFRTLLRFRMDAGDQILINHMKSAKKNATYMSPKIQNKLIEACGDVIKEQIAKKVNMVRCFTVLGDEASDRSCDSLLTVCVRYVDLENYVIREDFIGFSKLTNLCAPSVTRALLAMITNSGINLEYIRGQGYDGASVMQGASGGVQAYVREQYPLAVSTHCASHILNLILSKSCAVQSVRNMLGTVEDVGEFFRPTLHPSPQRKNVLLDMIEEHAPGSSHRILPKLCQSRWVERHESLTIFTELIVAITKALDHLAKGLDCNANTASRANTLRAAVTEFRFLVSLFVAERVFSVTVRLSQMLQSKQLDVVQCMALVEIVKERFVEMRTDAANIAREVYIKVQQVSEEVGATIRLPRRTAVQHHRDNYQTDIPCDHARQSILIPLLDNINNQLGIRFSKHTKTALKASFIIPSYLTLDSQCPDDLIEMYKDDLPGPVSIIPTEYALWKTKWKDVRKDLRPASALEALKVCYEAAFPNIHRLLLIYTTLPVTTASAERSFSAMRRLDTYLRNTMGEERLSGLALMAIQRDTTIDIDRVIQLFNSESRRLNFD